MTLTRKDRDQHPSIDIPHQTGGQLSHRKLNHLTRNEPSAGLGGNKDYISSWQLRVAGTQNSHEFDASSPSDKDHETNESHWRPNNLPVSPVLLKRDSKRRPRYFVDDKTITISSTASSISHDSSLHVSRNGHGGENPKRRGPPSHDSQCSSSDELAGAKKPRRKIKPSRYETNKGKSQAEEHHRPKETKPRPRNGQAREKPKRRRSSSHDSQCSSSDELVFTKKPRHKTKPDRYETKKRNNQPKDDKSKKPKTRPRKKKHELRSSRDVVDNFTSEAISGKKLIVSKNQMVCFQIVLT